MGRIFFFVPLFRRRAVNHPTLKDGAWSPKTPSQVDQGKRYPIRYVNHRSFRRTSKCFLSLLLCKALIMLGQGKGPKVETAACKSWSRLWTFPRGAASQEARHQARKG